MTTETKQWDEGRAGALSVRVRGRGLLAERGQGGVGVQAGSLHNEPPVAGAGGD